MSFDPHANFGYSTVATAPSPATSGTSLVVQSGDGAKFPATPFNATIWPAGSLPTSSNAEIVRVTNISTDTLTITRAQESSSARTVIVGDQIAATITAKTLQDVEDAISNEISNRSSAINVVSQGVSVLSQAVSVLSQAHSVLSQQVSNEISNRTSADNALSIRIDTQSQSVSVLSQQVSVLSQAVSVLSQAHSALSQAVSVLSNAASNALSVANAASNAASIVSTAASNALSVANAASNAASIVSTAASNALSVANAASNAASIVSNALSNEISNRTSAINVVSQAVSVLSQQVSVLSQQVSVLSQSISVINAVSAHTTAGTSVKGLQSVINALSSRISQAVGGFTASARTTAGTSVQGSQSVINALSARISQIAGGFVASARNAGGTSVQGSQSVINALSDKISVVSNAASNALSVANAASNAASIVSNALSNEISNRTSAVNVVSQAVSVLSQQVSVLSQAHSVLSQSVSVLSAIGNLISLQNVDAAAVSAGCPVYMGTSADTCKKAGNGGTSPTIGLVYDNSIAISAIGRVQIAGPITLTTGQWDNITGATGGLTPGSTYYLGATSGTLSTAPPATGPFSQVGFAKSPTVLILGISDTDQNTTSILNAVSNAQSVLSQAVSVLSQSVSVLSQQVSVVSSLVSNLTSAHNALSNTISGVSAHTTAGTSVKGLQSVINALSSRISQVGGGFTASARTTAGTSVQGSQSVINALSACISVVSQAVSIVSTAASNALSVANAASNAASIVSNALSNEISNRQSAVNVVSQAVSVLSQQVSILSQAVSVLSSWAVIQALNVEAGALSAGMPVYQSFSTTTSTTGAEIKKAGNGIADPFKVLGVVLNNSVAQSATANVQIEGIISLTSAQWTDRISNGESALSIGTTYYLGSTSGKLSVAPTNAVGNCRVGIALDETHLLILPTPAQKDYLSQAISVVSQAVSVLSQSVSVQAAALSVRIDTQSQSVSVLSQQVSVLSQALSALSQAHSVVSNALSNEISNRTSADNALSNLISALSSKLSAVSAHTTAGTSVKGLQSVIDALSSRISQASGGFTASAKTTAGTSVQGAQSVINALSARISQIAGGFVASARTTAGTSVQGAQSVINALSACISQVSNALSNETSNRISADNALSQSISVISQQVSVLSQAHSVLSQQVSVLSTLVSTNAGGILVLQNVDAAAVSAGMPVYAFTSASTFKKADNDAGGAAQRVLGLVLDTSIAISATGNIQTQGVISLPTAQWDSVTGGTGGLTIGSNYYLDATAGKLTATLPSGAGKTAQAVGVALTTTAMQLRCQDVTDWLSDAISVGTATADALSNAISIVSNALSNEISNRTSAINVVSQAVSVLSQQVSVLSQQVSVLSQAHSVLSQAFSVLSAGLGGVQMRVLGNITTVSATAFTNVSGMSLSVTSAATYQIDGNLNFVVSTNNIAKFGFTFPAGITDGWIRIDGIASVIAAGGDNFISSIIYNGYQEAGGMSTVATVLTSALYGTSVTQYGARITGVIRTGATAGTVQLQALNSAAATSITFRLGSFLRAYKIA